MMMNDVDYKKDNRHKATEKEETANCFPEIKSIKKAIVSVKVYALVNSNIKINQTKAFKVLFRLICAKFIY